MAVNWRDVQDKAIEFVAEYKGASKEDQEAKAFWVRFFDIFGVRERSVGLFEKRVKLLKGGDGKIDFFAPGRFMIEHKSLDRDLDKAFKQAADYIDALPEDEKPQYLILCDFDTIRLYDFEATSERKGEIEFKLKDLPQKVQLFAFLTDEKVQVYKEEDPINVKAVRAVGRLYEAVRQTNHFTPAEASKLLTRLVFCFFADDIGIFNRNSMRRYLTEKTKADGTDIGAHLGQIFQVLDTDDGTGTQNVRPNTLHPDLAALPYVNGGLFGPDLKSIFGSREMRDELMTAMAFDWSRISPEIFGSMFQSVMDDKARHDIGAHYTSEANIRKVIDPLFLDALKGELEAAKSNEAKLKSLWKKIETITLLDPACGCGNFLVVSYKELRTIENEIIARLHGRADKRAFAHAESGHGRLDLGEVDLSTISRLSVSRMYGIELDPFAAEVARLSLWVVDHMMNMELGALFGRPLRKLPLTEQPSIVQGNALRLDWESVVPKDKLTHILGNPPFVGSKWMSEEQRHEIEDLFGDAKGSGILDYVTGWYVKAAAYIQGSAINVAFVSTNSIVQGEQVAALWKHLSRAYGVHIQFAHRTFKWSNEAQGKAAVHCVIVGFGREIAERPRIFDYREAKGDPIEIIAKHINYYLLDCPDVFIETRNTPLCDVPAMITGNQPIDGGNYLFTPEQKAAFLKLEPQADPYFKRWLGGEEFLNNVERYYLFLNDISPDQLRKMPESLRRVDNVRLFRQISKRPSTKRLADYPTKFQTTFNPKAPYLAMPQVSSERRRYIPIAFLDTTWLPGDKLRIVPDATLYHFGVMTSEMHMSWMRAVAGRLESRYQYSGRIVYNNFPWPTDATGAQKKAVEYAAQQVLDIRTKYPNSTLADLYDPLTMPPDLLAAHKALDRAVDACYGVKGFKSEPDRLVFLFEQYERLAKSN